jgi:hypothetical protein
LKNEIQDARIGCCCKAHHAHLQNRLERSKRGAMSAKKPAETTKKQAVLDYLAANPKAANADVVTALAEQGIAISARDISTIKYHAKKAKRVRPRAKASKMADANAKRKYLQRPYPQKTLQEALTLPEKIKEKNNGNPWATSDAANACGYTNLRSLNFYNGRGFSGARIRWIRR